MAAGSKVGIRDRDNTGEVARVVNGRLLVSGVGGGGGGDVNIAEYGGVAVGPANPLDVEVQGTVTVSQDACWLIDNCAGTELTVDQRSHANLLAQVRVQDGDGSDLMGVYQTGDAAPLFPDLPLGPTVMMEYPSDIPAPDQGDWQHLTCDVDGRLRVAIDTSVAVTVSNSVNLTAQHDEDDAHASGDTGVMMLGVRQDTPASLAGTDGDYTAPIFGSDGALWTRLAGMETIESIVLSGSTRGRPIQITGTTTGTAVTLHTATTTAGEVDRIYIDLTNTSSAAVTVTIEFGATGVGNEIDIIVPANDTVRAVDGVLLGGAATDTIEAYATTANVINAIGKVERITQP